MVGGVEGGDLGDVLDAQVEGVDEPPRRRQVRRGLHRRDRLGGVQRVDEDEVRVVRGRRPGREVGEVAQVADAPGPRRAHLVELGHQPDDPARGHRLGQLEALGGDDERRRSEWSGRARRRRPRRRAGASRAAGRRAARRWPRRPGARRRRGPVPTGRPVARGGSPPSSSSTCTVTREPAGTCTGTWCSPAGARDDRRRQGAAPGGVGVLGERGLDLGVGPRRPPRGRRGPRGWSRRETVTCWPNQSQYSVATPWAWASSTSRDDGAGCMPPSCQQRGRARTPVRSRPRRPSGVGRLLVQGFEHLLDPGVPGVREVVAPDRVVACPREPWPRAARRSAPRRRGG